jgi:hypothetical protein
MDKALLTSALLEKREGAPFPWLYKVSIQDASAKYTGEAIGSGPVHFARGSKQRAAPGWQLSLFYSGSAGQVVVGEIALR